MLRTARGAQESTVDIVDISLQRIDGNHKRLEEASVSARASTGCNHRPSGTSGGPCGPAGAIGGVCTHVEGRWTVVPFTVLRMSSWVQNQNPEDGSSEVSWHMLEKPKTIVKTSF